MAITRHSTYTPRFIRPYSTLTHPSYPTRCVSHRLSDAAATAALFHSPAHSSATSDRRHPSSYFHTLTNATRYSNASTSTRTLSPRHRVSSRTSLPHVSISIPSRTFAIAPPTPNANSNTSLWGYPSLITYQAWERAQQKLERYNEIGEKLNTGTLHHEELARLSKEYSSLSAVAQLVDRINGLRKEIRDCQLLIRGNDKDLAALAKDEMEEAASKAMELEQRVIGYLLPGAEDDQRSAILEIRMGIGGDEASLFARMMFHMYEAYARSQGWSWDVLDISDTEYGGYREASALIGGDDVFGKLKYESGVHRIQRVPPNDSRIHTSFATVAIMPEAEEVDVQINESKDLRIDVYRASGAGGQHVNKTESAVRITHLPTNTVVVMQDERSQIKNKEKAMKLLRTRLYDMARKEAEDSRAKLRSDQIGLGDRSERIRTYNFPRDQITDHRVNFTKTGVDQMLTGEYLEEFVEALANDALQKQLQNI